MSKTAAAVAAAKKAGSKGCAEDDSGCVNNECIACRNIAIRQRADARRVRDEYIAKKSKKPLRQKAVVSVDKEEKSPKNDDDDDEEEGNNTDESEDEEDEDDVPSTVGAWRQRHEKMMKKYRGMRSRWYALCDDNDELCVSVDVLIEKDSDQMKKLDRQRGDIKGLNAKLQLWQTKIKRAEALEEQLKNAEATITGLQKQNMEIRAKNKATRELADELKGQTEASRAEAAAREKDLLQLQKQAMAQKRQEVAKLEQAMADRDKQIVKAEGVVAKLKEMQRRPQPQHEYQATARSVELLQQQRTEALQAKELALKERDQALKDRDQALKDRDGLRQYQQQTQAFSWRDHLSPTIVARPPPPPYLPEHDVKACLAEKHKLVAAQQDLQNRLATLSQQSYARDMAAEDAATRNGHQLIAMAQQLATNNNEIVTLKAKQRATCAVCPDRLADQLLLPCGHVSLCSHCAERARTDKNGCLICRTPIVGLIRCCFS